MTCNRAHPKALRSVSHVYIQRGALTGAGAEESKRYLGKSNLLLAVEGIVQLLD